MDEACRRTHVKGIVLERDENLPPFGEITRRVAAGARNREEARTMGLSDVQRALARLLTDADALRRAFAPTRRRVGKHGG